jgi:hypothetical protein
MGLNFILVRDKNLRSSHDLTQIAEIVLKKDCFGAKWRSAKVKNCPNFTIFCQIIKI